MPDFSDTAFRLTPDSDIVRINPGVLVQVFTAGTETLIAEVTANADGHYDITTLPTGKYDIRLNGQTVQTIQHVKADHTHALEPTWTFFVPGAITADVEESSYLSIHMAPVAGKIVSIRIVVQALNSGGDIFVHLLRGTAGGGSAMTLVGNTVWNHRVHPGVGQWRYAYADNNPNIALAANDCVAVGIDHVANSVAGLTVEVTFRPD